MSNHLLKFINGNKPIFNAEYAILSAPVRHLFMIASIWNLNKAKKAKDPNFQILEIGSWVGASALSFAQGLREHNGSMGTITCVDAWRPFFDRNTHNKEIYAAMENALQSETAYNLFLHNIRTIPESIACQHFRGTSNQILPLLKSEAFDIVFVDADHSYTPVKSDINNSLRLVKEGGIICGDDLNLQMFQVDKKVAKEFCESDFIKDEKSTRNYHPGVTVAVDEIFGEVSVWGGFWAMQKQGATWKKISFRDMPVIFPEHFPDDAKQKAAAHFKDIEVS